MAIATTASIKYKCGHTQATDLSKVPAGRRKAHAYGLGRNRICVRCFSKENATGLKAWQAERTTQSLADAESFENDHHLPPVEGSEKQVPWATRARYELLSSALEVLTVEADEPLSYQAFEERILSPARQITRAGWWIDNNDVDTADVEELVSTAVDDAESPGKTENPF
ncbi:putative NACHT family NTPase [Arthrobacter sp. UYNi723]